MFAILVNAAKCVAVIGGLSDEQALQVMDAFSHLDTAMAQYSDGKELDQIRAQANMAFSESLEGKKPNCFEQKAALKEMYRKMNEDKKNKK